MSNPSFKDGIIKIGKSDRHPSERKRELETTGVPDQFKLEYYTLVDDHHNLERKIHLKLREHRTNISREFFKISIPKAIDTIRKLVGDANSREKILWEDPAEVERETQQRKKTEETREKTGQIESRMVALKKDLIELVNQYNATIDNELTDMFILRGTKLKTFTGYGCLLTIPFYLIVFTVFLALIENAAMAYLISLIIFITTSCIFSSKRNAEKKMERENMDFYIAKWNNSIHSYVNDIDRKVNEIKLRLMEDSLWQKNISAYEAREKYALAKILADKKDPIIAMARRKVSLIQ